MKKTIFIIAALAVLSLAVVGGAFAQSPDGPGEPNPLCETGDCVGSQGNRWQRSETDDFVGNGRQGNQGQLGLLEDYLHDKLAAALGLTSEELAARNANQESYWEIAEAQGFTYEEALAIRTQARVAAMQEAQGDGVITPEQAQIMAGGMGQMGNGGMGQSGMGQGSGDCDGTGPQNAGPQGAGNGNSGQNQGGNGRGK